MESAKCLQDLCVQAILNELRQAYHEEYGYAWVKESVSKCPPALIHQLMIRVAGVQPAFHLDLPDFGTLIDTNKLKHIELRDIKIVPSEVGQLMKALSPQSQQLETFVFTVNSTDDLPHPHTIAVLLSSTTNLRVLNTNMYLPLWVLRKLKILETLIAPRLCDSPKPKRGRVFKAMSDVLTTNRTLQEELVHFLRTSPNLMTFECPYIVETFSAFLLQSYDQVESCDTPKFNLHTVKFRRKMGAFVTFGNERRGVSLKPSDFASSEILTFLQTSCPSLCRLRITINSTDSLKGLSVFKRLTKLSIVVSRTSATEPIHLDENCLRLLSGLRHTLISLSVENFDNIDFCRIGATFPYLRKLSIRGYHREVGVNSWPSNSFYFSCLERLYIAPSFTVCPPRQGLLKSILSQCKVLKEVEVRGASVISDEFLDVLLEANELEYLEDLHFHDCRVSEEGAIKLKTTCERLKPLTFRKYFLNHDDHVCLATNTRRDPENDPETELLNNLDEATFH